MSFTPVCGQGPPVGTSSLQCREGYSKLTQGSYLAWMFYLQVFKYSIGVFTKMPLPGETVVKHSLPLFWYLWERALISQI